MLNGSLPNYQGICNFRAKTKTYINAHLTLDFDQRKITIHIAEHGFDFYPTGENGWPKIEDFSIAEVRILTNSGVLTAESITLSFLVGIKPSPMSISHTELSWALGAEGVGTTLSFAANQPLKFISSYEVDEIIFAPGNDTVGIVNSVSGLQLNGKNEHISLIGKQNLDLQLLATCVSVTVGSVSYPIVSQKGKEVTIFLYNFGIGHRSTPLFFVGTIWDLSKARDSYKTLYDAIFNFINEDAHALEFFNAVKVFLEARNAPQQYASKLLGGFYFLEWIDGSKRISENQLATVLQVTRKEADEIKRVRDQVIHNQGGQIQTIETAVRALRSLGTTKFSQYDVGDYQLSFLNYLFSLLVESLFRKIGCNLPVQPYFIGNV